MLAPPRLLSQLATSYIASLPQGIRQKPFNNKSYLIKTHHWIALPTGKMPADPSLIFVRLCLLLEHDLKAQGSRSYSSFTMSMPVGERRRAIPDAICELMLGCATAFKAGPPVICLPAPAGWWSQTESNRRHPACKAGALPTELWPLFFKRSGLARRAGRDPKFRRRVVGLGRLELPTLRLSGVRSNHLSYRPMTAFAGSCLRARDRLGP